MANICHSVTQCSTAKVDRLSKADPLQKMCVNKPTISATISNAENTLEIAMMHKKTILSHAYTNSTRVCNDS